jgi:bacteriorhodopsin
VRRHRDVRQELTPARSLTLAPLRYVRWVSYSLIWPLVVYMLLLATGRPVSEYVVTIGFTLVYAVCFLIGALVRSSYKWGFFTIGLFAMFVRLDRKQVGALLPEPSN